MPLEQEGNWVVQTKMIASKGEKKVPCCCQCSSHHSVIDGKLGCPDREFSPQKYNMKENNIYLKQ